MTPRSPYYFDVDSVWGAWFFDDLQFMETGQLFVFSLSFQYLALQESVPFFEQFSGREGEGIL